LLASIMMLLAGTGVLLLAVGIFAAATTALRAARGEIAVRQAIGARPYQAARAPLKALTRATALGMLLGTSLTPPLLSAANALGLAADDVVTPTLLAMVVIPVLTATAVAPLVRRAAATTPAELLRHD
jgi:hypothetical protein